MSISCKGTCGDVCCTSMVKTLTVEEAERLRARADEQGVEIHTEDGIWDSLVTMTDMPCPFYVEKKCTIYDDRPMVCRTYHCDACGSQDERRAESRRVFRAERNAENGWIRFHPPDE